MFQSFGVPELLIILAIVVVLFGATRIGDIGKGVGRAIREFRREVKEGQEEGPKKEAQGTTTSKSTTSTPGDDEKRFTQH